MRKKLLKFSDLRQIVSKNVWKKISVRQRSCLEVKLFLVTDKHQKCHRWILLFYEALTWIDLWCDAQTCLRWINRKALVDKSDNVARNIYDTCIGPRNHESSGFVWTLRNSAAKLFRLFDPQLAALSLSLCIRWNEILFRNINVFMLGHSA